MKRNFKELYALTKKENKKTATQRQPGMIKKLNKKAYCSVQHFPMYAQVSTIALNDCYPKSNFIRNGIM